MQSHKKQACEHSDCGHPCRTFYRFLYSLHPTRLVKGRYRGRGCEAIRCAGCINGVDAVPVFVNGKTVQVSLANFEDPYRPLHCLGCSSPDMGWLHGLLQVSKYVNGVLWRNGTLAFVCETCLEETSISMAGQTVVIFAKDARGQISAELHERCPRNPQG